MTEYKKETDQELLMAMQRVEEECFIDINKKIELPPVAISYGTKEITMSDGNIKEIPVPIGTYGNFSFIQAPPKSMKTFFASLLGSAYCNPEGNYTMGMNSFRGDREFIHIDTEQSDWHSQRVMKRIQWMNKGVNLDHYHTFALRRESCSSRVSFIEHYLTKLQDDGKKIGLVIIDGIADLIKNVNNEEEASYITQKIMTWTSVFDCHISTIIHSNYGSEKPTGHLGSLLEKKTETQIKLDKGDDGFVTATCRRGRNTPFKDFKFTLDGNGLPYIDDVNRF
jgi:hypothetical protein